jgi:hypothetical protein
VAAALMLLALRFRPDLRMGTNKAATARYRHPER